MAPSSLARCGAFLEQLQVERLKLGLKSGEECFYRGQSHSAWPLESSLLRHCRYAKTKGGRRIQRLESDLFYEFKRRARELQMQDWMGWDILFAMRHHGVATRLIDWTEVPAIALFFATYKLTDDASPCIWLLNPYILNEDFDGDHDLCGAEFLPGKYEKYIVDPYPAIPWKRPIALYPMQRNPRLFAQQGYFTIQGSDLTPLEKQVPALVKKVPIPKEVVDAAPDFLSAVGITEYSMFPDLDNLAAFVNHKNGVGLQSPKLL